MSAKWAIPSWSAWSHNDSLGSKLATALASTLGTCAFFQARASAADNPAKRLDEQLQQPHLPVCIHYHQIVLGFSIDDDGSRWLRDGEVSTGVLAAIDYPQNVAVIGTVESQAHRP